MSQQIEALIMVAPLLILLGILFYAVFFHSKKRWPDVNWGVRYSRIMTFYKDPKKIKEVKKYEAM